MDYAGCQHRFSPDKICLTHLEHLGSADNWLSGDVALGNHHLLGHEDLTGWDLDTEVTSGNHDTVGLLEDLVKVQDTLLVLDLDDDLDVGALDAKHLSDLLDIVSASDKRGEDHVDTVLDTESEIGLVLLGQSWEVDWGLWQVDTFSRGQGAGVEGLDSELVAVDGDDLEGEDSVIDVDELAWAEDFDNVGLQTIIRCLRNDTETGQLT